MTFVIGVLARGSWGSGFVVLIAGINGTTIKAEGILNKNRLSAHFPYVLVCFCPVFKFKKLYSLSGIGEAKTC